MTNVKTIPAPRRPNTVPPSMQYDSLHSTDPNA